MACAGERDRREAHGIASGESGSQPEDDPTGRELVDGRNGVGSHRSDTIARDGDAGPQDNRAGMLRSQRHARIHIAIDHLGVVQPGMAEALVFSHGNIFPRIRFRRVGNGKFHEGPPSFC